MCVQLSPVLSGPAIHWNIQGVDSSRLNVSLDITHYWREREREKREEWVDERMGWQRSDFMHLTTEQ